MHKLAMGVALVLALSNYHIEARPLVNTTPTGTLFVIPPVEYDHPFAGAIHYYVVDNVGDLWKYCQRDTLGCTVDHEGLPIPAAWAGTWKKDGCFIVLASDAMIRNAGYTTAIVKRHEIGHCNGWPPDHPNARKWNGE